MNLTDIDDSILAALSTVGADTVSTLRGRTAYRHLDARSQATAHTAALKKLAARGLVRRLDNQKPIAWLRVARPDAP